ncbi:MAG TPA: hypothetical protein EYP65_05485 [Armatimonadetes bacterium]|nr:hypothetical protein [Armatimonadota bacterium]
MEGKVLEIPVIWLQGATCTGCTISVLNGVSPSIKNVLLDEIVPGKHLNLRFQTTIMAGVGEPTLEILEDTRERKKGEYLLVVEGAIPTAEGGVYGTIGEETILDRVLKMGRDAMLVVALGTCASYGGIPSGSPNPTGCKGVLEIFKEQGLETPVVCVPGCPPHPDWFVGTCVHILMFGPPKEELDELRRLKLFYAKLIHDNCPRRGYFDTGRLAKRPGEEGCLYEVGCKGYITYSDCPLRKWNGGINWCVENGHPCIGCCEPTFPDVNSPFFEKFGEERLPRLEADPETGRLKAGVGPATSSGAQG